MMQQTIDTPITIQTLATRVGAGRRQLERHFLQALNISPAEAYKIIRLDFADFLLKTTNNSLSHIALETGFCDTSHFIRLFKARHNKTPAQVRQSLERTRLAESNLRKALESRHWHQN